jgi:hypothetical protein
MGLLKESVGRWEGAVKPDRVQKHKGGFRQKAAQKAAKATDFLLFCRGL